MPKLKEIGVSVENVNARDFVAQAQAAERLGFDSFWVPEDYVSAVGRSLRLVSRQARRARSSSWRAVRSSPRTWKRCIGP